MAEQFICPEISKLFNNEPASRNRIIAENHHWIEDADSYIASGATVGQMTLDGDTIIYPLPIKPYAGIEAPFTLEYKVFEQ